MRKVASGSAIEPIDQLEMSLETWAQRFAPLPTLRLLC